MIKTITAGLALVLMTTAAQCVTYAVQAGHLIVDAAKPARGASTVIVTDGRVTRIENGATAPAGATVVDMRDKTVMPGLIDVHVHLTSDANLPWYETLRPKYSESYAAITGVKNALITARAGFTTVRDVGSSGASAIAVRDAILDGSVPGPRLEVSGQPLSIIGGHADPRGRIVPRSARCNRRQPRHVHRLHGHGGMQQGGSAARLGGRRSDQVHGDGRRARPRRYRPRTAFHRCRDEGDHRHRACAPT